MMRAQGWMKFRRCCGRCFARMGRFSARGICGRRGARLVQSLDWACMRSDAIGGLTIYDLRRSAARDLIRAGVPRGLAMTITSDKTEAVFERYNITDTSDVREALIKLGQYAKIVQASRA